MNILQFTHSSVDGQLGSQLLAITNKAAVNIHVQVILRTYAFILLRYILELEQSNHMVGVCLSF